MSKKVVLFIVEGVSDERSLGLILSRIISSKQAKFHVVRGDLTSRDTTNSSNAVTEVKKEIDRFLNENFFYKTSDIGNVIHLIDTDGAFIDDSVIEQADVDGFIYTETNILARNVDEVVARNKRKNSVVNKLINCNKIGTIPYQTYFFSCNLEHVLHNKIDVEDSEKVEYANRFVDRFYGEERTFIDFMNKSEFTVEGDYKQTWQFIMADNNSLKRYSNFHLYFE